MPFLSLNLQLFMFQSQRKDCSTTVEWVLSGQHMVGLQKYLEEISKLCIMNY